jgi:hypothetical protein
MAIQVEHWSTCDGTNHAKCRCQCGYAPDSFACKIRHLQVNTGDAKATSPHVEIRPNGRIIR